MKKIIILSLLLMLNLFCGDRGPASSGSPQDGGDGTDTEVPGKWGTAILGQSTYGP
jgi:hypothetical protein